MALFGVSHNVIVSLSLLADVHIRMILTPGRIGDMADDGLQLALRVVAVVKTDRIETQTPVAQVGEQGDSALRTLSAGIGNQATYALIQR